MAADRGRPERGVAAPDSARALAIRVLLRVTERGAYASRALDAELARAKLDERDAALATEIVYGALRVLPALDRRLDAHLKRKIATLDPLLRAALRAGCYQLCHLSRSAPHAVVDESVGAVRAARGRELAGVANAVLRKLAAEGPGEPVRGLLLPGWLEQAMVRGLGPERAARVLDAAAGPPPLALRARKHISREALLAELRAARPGAEFRLGRVSPYALLAFRGGDPRALPGYADGRFAVQEEGAQVVGLALGARPGETVADLCAGHGGKTALLCEAVGAHGAVTAVDLDERKLERGERELARLGLGSARVERLAVDLSVGTAGLGPRFDRVLVDAPCTGVGTLRRRPELMLRWKPGDPARLAELQLSVLRNAQKLVRPGGVLLYAVCSATEEEGAGVARRFEAEQAGRVTRDFDIFGPAEGGCSLRPDSDGLLRLGPWLTEDAADSPDVYQLARWRISAG